MTQPDHSWPARATALNRERPAGLAATAAIFAALAALMSWLAVLIPSGRIRGNPIFWLLALPLLPWFRGVATFAPWAANTLWLALLLAPCLSLLALLAAHSLGAHDALATTTPLDTPTAMAILLAITLALSCAGLVALRRSSLPGGTRAPTYLAPGTPLPGFQPLPPEALGAIKLGSLCLSGTVVNGTLFAIVAAMEPIGPAGAFWPPALVAALAITVGALAIRGTYRLRRGTPALPGIRLAYRLGTFATLAALAALWAWPTLLTTKLAFSAFMAPIALATAWCTTRALRTLTSLDQTPTHS